ncbi:MAG: hypothetical protein JWP61_339 [Friedmanniella sp.]|nr:hypothetical protein [Friedmanniella sp.]
MRKAWRLLTPRGRTLLVAGLLVLLVAMVAGQRDVMRIGLLLMALPVLAGILVSRAQLRMSCERSVEPSQVPLGTPLRGQITLGQEGVLPVGMLLMEDAVPRELGHPPRFVVDRSGASWRRVVDYPLLGRVRGRFRTGPLTVRTTDPFGLVRLDRRFLATSEVMVTPEIVPLSPLRTVGGGGSTGEARPHRIGVVGSDDALVREYRQGDDVRRVHWRSTARRGELMVRREEQAWDPSASILLDSRAAAHAGTGMQSSLEWAVSAAASVAVHFLDDGFGVEVYAPDGPLHVAGGSGPRSPVARELVLNRLTDLRASTAGNLGYAAQSAALERAGQLVVAVLGAVDAGDANALLRVRRHRAQGVALLLEVEAYLPATTDSRTTPRDPARLRRDRTVAARILRDDHWRVLEVPRGMGVAEAWSALEQLGEVA